MHKHRYALPETIRSGLHTGVLRRCSLFICFGIASESDVVESGGGTVVGPYAARAKVKGALYRIWCGVNRLGDSGVKVV